MQLAFCKEKKIGHFDLIYTGFSKRKKKVKEKVAETDEKKWAQKWSHLDEVYKLD